jgi:hypothetical protein
MKLFMEPARVCRASHSQVLIASVIWGFTIRNNYEFYMLLSPYDV